MYSRSHVAEQHIQFLLSWYINMWMYQDSKNCMCGIATYDRDHILTSCEDFGERPRRDYILRMECGGRLSLQTRYDDDDKTIQKLRWHQNP